MTAALRVLELLERFRFLTREHMRSAGLEISADHIGEVLRRLEKLGQVGHVSPGIVPGVGRLAFIYYLRKPGAVALAEANRLDLETLTWCDGTPELAHDRAHRLDCVTVHLWARAGAGQCSVGFPAVLHHAQDQRGDAA